MPIRLFMREPTFVRAPIRVFLDGHDLTSYGVLLARRDLGYVRVFTPLPWLPPPDEKNTDYTGRWIEYRYYGNVTFEGAEPHITEIRG